MTTQEPKKRTFEFGIRVVRAVEALPRSEVARDIGRQLLRAGTSVGANYRAAAYWMEVIIALKILKPTRLTRLHTESGELLAIVVASIKTARRTRRT